MCSVKVILVCVCIFIPNKICIGFIFSEHAQTSFFPTEELSVVPDIQQWESKPRNYGWGCSAGAEQGGLCHSCAPADAFSSPSFPVAGSPEGDSQIQRSAFQCLIMEGTIGEREKTLMTHGVNMREQGKRIAFEL